jgi:hypothetical protein
MGILRVQAGPPRAFAGPGANFLSGPHNIIIFQLDQVSHPSRP